MIFLFTFDYFAFEFWTMFVCGMFLNQCLLVGLGQTLKRWMWLPHGSSDWSLWGNSASRKLNATAKRNWRYTRGTHWKFTSWFSRIRARPEISTTSSERSLKIQKENLLNFVLSNFIMLFALLFTGVLISWAKFSSLTRVLSPASPSPSIDRTTASIHVFRKSVLKTVSHGSSRPWV